jgi:hypothetical protein
MRLAPARVPLAEFLATPEGKKASGATGGVQGWKGTFFFQERMSHGLGRGDAWEKLRSELHECMNKKGYTYK